MNYFLISSGKDEVKTEIKTHNHQQQNKNKKRDHIY